MEDLTPDAIDRQIIHVLTVEPRASFRTIAEVAGISDQTAARRYRRLTESAGLRVLGVLDGTKLGWVSWFVRLQVVPGSADAIAEALARRPDTRWVNLASAGTEIICTVEARTTEQHDALFLRGLPGSRRVVQISAHLILHNYTKGAWRGITQELTPEQLALLAGGATPQDAPLAGGATPQDPPAPGGSLPPSPPLGTLRAPAVLSAEDEPLLDELARDGRTSNAAIATAIHWHESTVRRRIDELRRSGLLHFEVDLDSTGYGVNVRATLWLSVEPARLDEVGQAIAGHLEAPFVGATTGPTNLVVAALFRDTEHLYHYLTGQLASLPGVTSVETAPTIRTLKRTGPVH